MLDTSVVMRYVLFFIVRQTGVQTAMGDVLSVRNAREALLSFIASGKCLSECLVVRISQPPEDQDVINLEGMMMFVASALVVNKVQHLLESICAFKEHPGKIDTDVRIMITFANSSTLEDVSRIKGMVDSLFQYQPASVVREIIVSTLKDEVINLANLDDSGTVH